MGKVALSLRPGQAGAQSRGAGHSAGPGVHGPREPGASAALQATGLFTLQADRLRLEALRPSERREQRRRGQGGLASHRVGGKRGRPVGGELEAGTGKGDLGPFVGGLKVMWGGGS